MISQIEGEVICDVRNLVLYTIVIGEEFIAERHIRLHDLIAISILTSHDVDEGEFRGVGSTHIGDIRIGKEQLVGDLIAKAAVEVGRQ